MGSSSDQWLVRQSGNVPWRQVLVNAGLSPMHDRGPNAKCKGGTIFIECPPESWAGAIYIDYDGVERIQLYTWSKREYKEQVERALIDAGFRWGKIPEAEYMKLVRPESPA